MDSARLSGLWTDVMSNEASVCDSARQFAPDVAAKMQELLDEDDEWQQRLQRWKARQQSKAAVKQEGPEGKDEGKAQADRMDVDDEAEPDESELMRKNKQRQWTLLRLLRRYDFPLFQKSDGKLDRVVDELKKRRQQAADKAAKEHTERTKAEEEAKDAAKETADGSEAEVVVATDDETGSRMDEAGKDGDGEKLEAGTDEMAQGEDGMAAIELERKSEPADDPTAGGKEPPDTEERVEAEREEDDEEEREEARSSRRGEARDDDSPRTGAKRRTDAAGSDDDTGDSSKRQRTEDEADVQQHSKAQQTLRGRPLTRRLLLCLRLSWPLPAAAASTNTNTASSLFCCFVGRTEDIHSLLSETGVV